VAPPATPVRRRCAPRVQPEPARTEVRVRVRSDHRNCRGPTRGHVPTGPTGIAVISADRGNRHGSYSDPGKERRHRPNTDGATPHKILREGFAPSTCSTRTCYFDDGMGPRPMGQFTRAIPTTENHLGNCLLVPGNSTRESPQRHTVTGSALGTSSADAPDRGLARLGL